MSYFMLFEGDRLPNFKLKKDGNPSSNVTKEFDKNFSKLKKVDSKSFSGLKSEQMSQEFMQDFEAFHGNRFKFKKNREEIKEGLVDTMKKIGITTKREAKETYYLSKLIGKMLMGHRPSEEEKFFLKNQSIDLAKILPILAIQMIPIPIPGLSIAVISLLKKYGVNLSTSELNIPNTLKRGIDMDETTGTGSAGSFVGPLFGDSKFIKKEEGNRILHKRDIKKIIELEEDTTTSSVGGSYVQPRIWAKSKDDWRGKNKLFKSGKFVKIKDKCKKFPYCNQSPEAIELSDTPNDKIDNVFESLSKKTGKSVEYIRQVYFNNKK